MTENSKIEWCDHTFNPWRGCAKVSPACKNCYAMQQVNRYGGDFLGKRVVAAESTWKQPLKWNRESEKQQIEASNHNHRFCLDAKVELIEPQRPRVFCASLADIFEDYSGQMSHSSAIPMWQMHQPNGHEHQWGAGHVLDDPNSGSPLTMDDVRRRLFQLIDATPNLDWLLLTKRPENIQKMWPEKLVNNALSPFKDKRYNVYLGTTVENQEQANKRIPELLQCRDLSPVLFLSCEPLLGPVDLRPALWLEDQYFKFRELMQRGIDWVIAGGESGREARPMHPDWARSLRDQCGAACVPFFFKQWGEWQDGSCQDSSKNGCMLTNGNLVFPDSLDGRQSLDWTLKGAWNRFNPTMIAKVGKKKSGRLLDGSLHNAFPDGGQHGG